MHENENGNGHGLHYTIATDPKTRRSDITVTRNGEIFAAECVNILNKAARLRLVEALAEKIDDAEKAKLHAALLEEAGNWAAPRDDDDGGDGESGAPDEDSPDQKGSPATELLLRCCEDVERFRCGDTAYGSVSIDGHTVTMPLESRQFKTWLRGEYFKQFRKAVRGEALAEVIGVLVAQALFGSSSWPVYSRIAPHGEDIVIDLCDELHRAVVVTRTGWRVVDRAPVRFIRKAGMKALPVPVKGGDLKELRKFVNVADDGDWALALAWLIAAMRPAGPFPLLEVSGEQGAAKSTFCKMFRALVDPNAAPLRSEPKDVRDLMIAATNGWIIALDNLSDLPPWLSDALCRLATGGGFSTRSLYTNDEEMIFDAMRPVTVCGIPELATRPDLGDRAIRLQLSVISEVSRRTERELWAAFNAARPRILGALLGAVSVGLRRLDTINLPMMPRMADFAEWATACEPGLGLTDGAFLAAYTANRHAGIEASIECSIIGPPLRALLKAENGFAGTTRELMAKLSTDVYSTEALRRDREWPKTPQKFTGLLKRIAPSLRATGWTIERERAADHGRARQIVIQRLGESTSSTSSTSNTSDAAKKRP